jgi:hypothetical protein
MTTTRHHCHRTALPVHCVVPPTRTHAFIITATTPRSTLDQRADRLRAALAADARPLALTFSALKGVTPDGRLPDAALGAEHLRDVFYRMGFDDQEIVALSGAHSLGFCHDDRSGFVGAWTETPHEFTNKCEREQPPFCTTNHTSSHPLTHLVPPRASTHTHIHTHTHTHIHTATKRHHQVFQEGTAHTQPPTTSRATIWHFNCAAHSHARPPNHITRNLLGISSTSRTRSGSSSSGAALLSLRTRTTAAS